MCKLGKNVIVLCIVATMMLGPLLAAPVGQGISYSGMVSTSHPLASQAGARILAEEGNAVDTAIAVHFALNAVEPMMSGIGGGGFMMICLANENKTVIIDFREKAPKGATSDMFLNEDGTPMEFEDAVRSGKSVGVPGTLLGLFTANKLYGTMPFDKLIDPAIELAEKGHRINRPLAESITESMGKFNEAARNVFAPDGVPLPEGTLLVQPDLAKTLKLIRDYGPSVLYSNNKNCPRKPFAIRYVDEVGRAIVDAVQSKGGVMSIDDLQGYNVSFREPVRGTYRGYEIVTMPPPSSGGLTLLQMLKILEDFDLKSMGLLTPDEMHLVIETMHLAYADRNKYLADSDFVEVPYAKYLDPEYISERRALINMSAANPNVKQGDLWQDDKEQGSTYQKNDNPNGETTHFTVRDRWGNLVACTTTIEQPFGSGIMVPGYGFMLNNEMTDFDFVPGGVTRSNLARGREAA